MNVRMSNQSGFAMIATVIGVSIVIVSTLSSIYVYQMNQLRYQMRIKEAYKLMSVMEESSKVVRAAWDTSAAKELGEVTNWQTRLKEEGDPALLGLNTAISGRMAQSLADIAEQENSQCTKPSDTSLCFVNPDKPNDPDACYCFQVDPVPVALNSIDLELQNKKSPLNRNKLERFLAKLDGFFDSETNLYKEKITLDHPSFGLGRPTMIGWLFYEGRALADGSTGNSQSTAAHQITFNKPQCDGTTPAASCVSCNKNGQGSFCHMMKSCPSSLGSVCDEYDSSDCVEARSDCSVAGNCAGLAEECRAKLVQPFRVVPIGDRQS